MEPTDAIPADDQTLEAQSLVIRSLRSDGRHTLALTGELDLEGCSLLDAELRRVETADVDQIVVDLSGLDFIDSSGIQTLVSAHRRSALDNGRLSFRRGRGQVNHVLALTGLGRSFEFVD